MGWKTYDFECQQCHHVFEDMVEGSVGKPEVCPDCGFAEGFDRLMSSPALMTSVVPSYPGSKRVKAGYQHTHNRAAEKKGSQISMSGTGGVPKNGS